MFNISVWFLAYMRINIPWKNLSSEQTLIHLDGIYLVLVPYLSMYLLSICIIILFIIAIIYNGMAR